MNLKYLGDALDHWKGSLLQRLYKEGLLINLHADPMITDSRPWDDAEIHVYSKMLNMETNRILNATKLFRGNIANYFSYSYHGDLFVDPDTGIATGDRCYKHITVDEIDTLLSKNGDRIISIYQHNAQGMRMPDRVDRVIRHLNNEIPGIVLSSYESATVAMLFASRNEKRICDIFNCLQNMLGPAAKRTRLWK